MSDVKVTIDLTGTETPRSRTGRTREEIKAEADAKKAQREAEKEQKQKDRAAEKERKDQESIANKRKKDLESAMQDELSAREAVIQKMASFLGFGEVFNFVKSIEKVKASAERVEKLASLGEDTIPTKLNETGIALENFVDRLGKIFDQFSGPPKRNAMDDGQSDIVDAERVDDTVSSAKKMSKVVDRAAKQSNKFNRKTGDTFPIKQGQRELNVRYRELKISDGDGLFKRARPMYGPPLPPDMAKARAGGSGAGNPNAMATGAGGGGRVPPLGGAAAAGGAGAGAGAAASAAGATAATIAAVLSVVAIIGVVVLAFMALVKVADYLAQKFNELDRWVGNNVKAFSRFSGVLLSELALRDLNRIQQEMRAGRALEGPGVDYIRTQTELDTAIIELKTEISRFVIPAVNEIKSTLTAYMKLFGDFLRIVNDSNIKQLSDTILKFVRPVELMDPFFAKFWGNMYDTMKSAMSDSNEELAEEAGNEVERELAEFFGFDMARVMNPRMRRELPLFEGNIED